MERLTKRCGSNTAVPGTFDIDFVFDMDEKAAKAFFDMCNRLADYEDTGLSPAEVHAVAPSGPAIDLAAHLLYATPVHRRTGAAYCRRCGTTLKTAYHESRLYSVTCPDCQTVTLVQSKSWDDAARVVGEPKPQGEGRA